MLAGFVGHAFSQAPQPVHLSARTIGLFLESVSMALNRHASTQNRHFAPFHWRHVLRSMEAAPILTSAGSTRFMAPAAQTRSQA